MDVDIRTACARVGGSASLPTDMTEQLIAAKLANEAAEVARQCGISRNEVCLDSVGLADDKPSMTAAAGADTPCLSDMGPAYLKTKEQRHWYCVGQSSSYYAALVAEHKAKQPMTAHKNQPTSPSSSNSSTSNGGDTPLPQS